MTDARTAGLEAMLCGAQAEVARLRAERDAHYERIGVLEAEVARLQEALSTMASNSRTALVEAADTLNATEAEVARLREALDAMLRDFGDSVDPTDADGQSVIERARAARVQP